MTSVQKCLTGIVIWPWKTKRIDPGEVGVLLKRLMIERAVVQEVMIGLAKHGLGQEMGRAYS